MADLATAPVSSFGSTVKLDDLRAAFERHWASSTSADPKHWSRQNPSYGQCAVTALVIQDYFGGDLLRARVGGVTHYWNRIDSGQEVDLTRQQFGKSADVPQGDRRSREYVLSFPETARRYQALSEAIQESLPLSSAYSGA